MYLRWEAGNGLKVARFGHALAALDGGGLVVLGGIHTEIPLSSGEVYDPNTNDWKALKTQMAVGRFGTVAASRNDKVYAVGGLSALNEALPSIEEYSLTTGEWVTLPASMIQQRCGHAVCMLSLYYSPCPVSCQAWCVGASRKGAHGVTNRNRSLCAHPSSPANPLIIVSPGHHLQRQAVRCGRFIVWTPHASN
jgi:hypothetical protein